PVGTAFKHFDNAGFGLAAKFARQAGQNAVAMQHFQHFPRRKEEIGPAIVANEEAETIAVTLHTPFDEGCGVACLQLALTVDRKLTIALHGPQSTLEAHRYRQVNLQRLRKMFNGNSTLRLPQGGKNIFPAGDT